MDDAGKKEARTKIDTIMADAQKPGADFAALAQAHSDCPSKTKGGDLNFFSKERMVPPFSKAAFATEAGQIHSEIVETQFGYHIIKVTDKKEARTIPFAEAKDGVRTTLVNQKKNESPPRTATRNSVTRPGTMSNVWKNRLCQECRACLLGPGSNRFGWLKKARSNAGLFSYHFGYLVKTVILLTVHSFFGCNQWPT